MQDSKEHAIAFGRDLNSKVICSGITNGNVISGNIPAITRAFADIHNHPNDTPPDAGDFYGLIDINRNNSEYDTRFVITKSHTVYALLVTDHLAAEAFNINYQRQMPAFAGGPPGFPINMVDEFREIKYNHNCTDEMAMAFILEKYDAGVSLLKQDGEGVFRKLVTSVSGAGSQLIFTVSYCQ